MNYLLNHKWIFLLSALCLFITFVYSKISTFNTETTDELLFAMPSGNQPPSSLHTFSLDDPEIWLSYPSEGDLFTKSALSKPIILSNDSDQNSIPEEFPIQNESCSIQLDGWANIKGKMVFVLSSLELNTALLGSTGDSFETPAFTILSVDFKTLQNHSSEYSIPLVTIFDKSLSKKFILAPAYCKEHFNEIN